MRRRTILKGLGAGAGLSLTPMAWGETRPGRWLRFESPHFTYFSTDDEDKARAEVAALEHYYAVLGILIPRQQRSEMKLVVYAADNAADLNRAWPGVGQDVAGFYSASVEHVHAVTAEFRARARQRDMPKDVRAMDARVVLFHEYAHHFMQASFRIRYPAWFGEGFAEFASTVDFADDSTWIGKFTNVRAAWLSSGDWLPIEKFLKPDDFTRNQVQLYYAQAWLATHYIFNNRERAVGMDKYALALANGDDPLEAFEPAFGISHGDFDKELRRYKRQRMVIFKLTEGGKDYAAGITVERLSAAADELLMPLANLRAVPLEERAKDNVALVREQAARYPDDPFAQRCLATVELWYGSLEAARSLLDQLIAGSPNDPEVQHLSGLCDLRRGYQAGDVELFKKARGQFAAAHRLDATRAHSLFRYVECLTNIESEFSLHMLEVSLEAYRLAPQARVIQLLAAQCLMKDKRWKEARDILLGAVTAAHDDDGGNRAQSLMAAAKAEQAPPLVFYGAASTMQVQPE